MVVPGATTYTMHRERELECSWQFPSSSYFLKNNKKKEEKANFFFFTWKQSKKQTNISLSFYLYFRRWRDCRQTINQVDVMTV